MDPGETDILLGGRYSVLEAKVFEREQREPQVELYPRRWIVRNAAGEVREVTQESRPYGAADVRVMGSHESLAQAAKRVGWAL